MREWLVAFSWLVALKILQALLDRIISTEFGKRKAMHVLVGLSVVPLALWIQHWYVAAFPVLLILSANAKANLQDVAPRSPVFQSYALVGVLLPLILILHSWREGHTKAIVLAVLLMTFGDAAAAIAGRLWGRHRLRERTEKTVEGSLANLAVSFTTIFAGTHSVPLSLITAFAAAAIEAILPGRWDNPVVLTAGLLILLYFNSVQ